MYTVMNGSDNYQSFLLQTTTIESTTDDRTDFIVGKEDLIYIVLINMGQALEKLNCISLDWKMFRQMFQTGCRKIT